MSTKYTNLIKGTLSAEVGSSDTSLSAAVLASLDEVAGSDQAWLVIDPDASNGAPEVVKVTAHTASATSVTVERAQQGTTARLHPSGSVVVHPVTAADLDGFLVEADLASMVPALSVTGVSVTGTVTAPPNQALHSASFDTEVFDSDGFISVPGSTATVPVGAAGVYTVTVVVDHTSGPNIAQSLSRVQLATTEYPFGEEVSLDMSHGGYTPPEPQPQVVVFSWTGVLAEGDAIGPVRVTSEEYGGFAADSIHDVTLTAVRLGALPS